MSSAAGAPSRLAVERKGSGLEGTAQNVFIHFAAEEKTSLNCIPTAHSKRASPRVCDLWQGCELNLRGFFESQFCA